MCSSDLRNDGRLLIVGAGVQGRVHLEAFVQGLAVNDVLIASRTPASADALVAHARSLGVRAQRSDNPDQDMTRCSLIVSCTSAQEVALKGIPPDDAFVSAVGAFKPQMVEWHPVVCRYLAQRGLVVVDSRDADHEAGDLLQAKIDVTRLASLSDVVNRRGAWSAQSRSRGPVFFKS